MTADPTNTPTPSEALPPYKIRAKVLQDGHIDPITGPRCLIVPDEGEHRGLYLIAHTAKILSAGQSVIYDEITCKAAPSEAAAIAQPSG